jgi:hypothetical protein
MRSVCSRSLLRRRASNRVIIRSETTRSTSSSTGRGRSWRSMAKRLPIRIRGGRSAALTSAIAVPLPPARPVRPARWI